MLVWKIKVVSNDRGPSRLAQRDALFYMCLVFSASQMLHCAPCDKAEDIYGTTKRNHSSGMTHPVIYHRTDVRCPSVLTKQLAQLRQVKQWVDG